MEGERNVVETQRRTGSLETSLSCVSQECTIDRGRKTIHSTGKHFFKLKSMMMILLVGISFLMLPAVGAYNSIEPAESSATKGV